MGTQMSNTNQKVKLLRDALHIQRWDLTWYDQLHKYAKEQKISRWDSTLPIDR